MLTNRRNNQRRRYTNPLSTRGRRVGNNRAPRNGRRRPTNQASHFDGHSQVRTINWTTGIGANNTQDGQAFGIGNIVFKFDGSQPFLQEWLTNQSRVYEQFKIRRCRVYVTPGANMTNDIRIRTKAMCRVDTDNFQPGSTPTVLGYLMASSNTVTKMLPDAAEVLMADWNPTVKPFLAGQSTDNGRQLPNALSWMAIRDNNGNLQFNNYEWKGAQLAIVTPDANFSTNNLPHLHVRVRLDIQLRGRVSTATVFHASNITEELSEPISFDLNGVFTDVRTNILNGSWFPIGTNWNTINVANVGHDLNLDLTGFKFRVQATMKVYTIQDWNNAEQAFGANENSA